MIKLALIDLDGVVADPSKRFEYAEQLASVLHDKKTQYKEWTQVYWQAVFDPERVETDTLIEGAVDALEALVIDGYQVIFLTSRPESMRAATAQWLVDHAVKTLGSEQLLMKPPAFQYTKTVTWKAGTIQMLACFYAAEEVLVIDDEHSASDALSTGGFADTCRLRCYTNLKMEEDEPKHDHPF